MKKNIKIEVISRQFMGDDDNDNDNDKEFVQ